MTDVDPYEALGVPRDATPEQIRSAYRRKASANHSDRGGSDIEMAMINTARDVLSDPDRRARFDRTGQAGRPQDAEGKAREMIFGLLVTALEEAPDDALIIASLRVNLADIDTELKLKEIQARGRIRKIERHAKRFKRPERGDVMVDVIDKRLKLRRAELEKFERDRQAVAIALRILADYDDDAPPGMPTLTICGVPIA